VVLVREGTKTWYLVDNNTLVYDRARREDMWVHDRKAYAAEQESANKS